MRQPRPFSVERVRSLAATATPTAVTLADEPQARLPVRGAIDHAGRAVILVPAEHPLHRVLRMTRWGRADLAASVHMSALRHVGQTSTVRARLWCEGWISVVPRDERRLAALLVGRRHPDTGLLATMDEEATPQTPLLARIEPALVIYDTHDRAGIMDGETYLSGAPDPLTTTAERLLAHINDCHRDVLNALLARVPEAPAGQAWLWELDRDGATLWVEPEASREPVLVRLPWNVSPASPHALRRAVHHLLTRGTRLPRPATPPEAGGPRG